MQTQPNTPTETNSSVAPHKTTLYVMIAVMVALFIGILFRWDYICEEVKETFNRSFPTQESAQEGESLTE